MHFAFISHDKYRFGEKHPWHTDNGYHHKQHLEPLLEAEIQCPVSELGPQEDRLDM
jgi:hypothetical protein